MDYDFSRIAISDELNTKLNENLKQRKRFGFYLAFDNDLEGLFFRYSLIRYRRINLTYPYVGIIGLLAFLVSDYQILPAALGELITIRVVGCIAILYSTWLLARQISNKDIHRAFKNTQLILCTSAIVIHIVLMRVGFIAADYGVLHYQAGSILLIILITTVIRIDFRYIMPTVVFIVASHMVFVNILPNVESTFVMGHFVTFTAVGVFSCLANARMEHEIRLNFLQRLIIEAERRQLRQTQEKLRQMSISDPLTGLLNRRGFEQHMTKIWAQAARNQEMTTVMMIDIDCFKQYNDTQGHPAGDVVLQKVAKVIHACVKRPNDIASRLGGEEFSVVLPQTDAEHGYQVAESIRDGVWQLQIFHPKSDFDQRVTLSIGMITVAPEPRSTFEDSINRADKLLYKAKNNGRNRVEQHVPN